MVGAASVNSLGIRGLTLAAIALVLSSCGILDRSQPPACPRVSIIGDAARVSKFRPGSRQDLTDLLFEAEITGLGGDCQYDDEGVTVDLTVFMTGARGPADLSRAGSVDYFVAIVGPDREILVKEGLSLRFDFAESRTRTALTDEVEQRIPLRSQSRGPEYEIMVGFQLTPDEIEQTRRRRAK